MNADNIIFVPTREQIESLKVGDMALDTFGKLSRVVEIHAQSNDIKGKAFVCYYTEFGPTSRVSMSMKEDELVRTCAACAQFKSAELETMERKIVAERNAAIAK